MEGLTPPVIFETIRMILSATGHFSKRVLVDGEPSCGTHEDTDRESS